MALQSFKRLVRFIPRSNTSSILIGQPLDDEVDVGIALFKGETVIVDVFTGSSVLSPGTATGKTESIGRLLSPVASNEIGTIRCIGLNYKQHAEEVGMPLPAIPTVFMKPNTALGDPWPAPTPLPKISQVDNCGDYESELVIIIGKEAKNVAEDEAMDYVLGYTACNDVSSRSSQFSQTQWCFSKGFDGSCPMGPVIASTSLITDPKKLTLRGLKNEELLQHCGIEDLIFSISHLVAFLSQSTTLPAGTAIITGTPAGVGAGRSPKVTLRHGDTFKVEILPHIGTLVSYFENE